MLILIILMDNELPYSTEKHTKQHSSYLPFSDITIEIDTKPVYHGKKYLQNQTRVFKTEIEKADMCKLLGTSVSLSLRV